MFEIYSLKYISDFVSKNIRYNNEMFKYFAILRIINTSKMVVGHETFQI